MEKDPLISFKPLGGVGNIGANCMLIEHQGKRILIDCGIIFPRDQHLGLNYLTPNFDLLEKHPIDYLLITHGHEDHVGAIPVLLEKYPQLKIYAPLFAAEVIKSKFEYFYKKREDLNLSIYKESDFFPFGDFEIHPIKVNHSIPDTFGFLIRSTQHKKSFFFASDFKVDTSNYYEPPFNFEKISSLNAEIEQKYFLADSTNVYNSGKTLSEKDLLENLDVLLEKHSRVFVTLFSSHIYRINSVVSLAIKNGKKIFYSGISLKRYLEIAEKCQALNFSLDLIHEREQYNGEENALILVAGCQGNFKSSLARIAYGRDPYYRIEKSDAVIFSSKTIPGNEKNVHSIYNKITETTPFLYHEGNTSKIHCSGHAGLEDIRISIEKIKPDVLIPIHGENFLMQYYQTLNLGPKIYNLRNHDEIHIRDNGELKYHHHEFSPHTAFLESSETIAREFLNQRKKVAERGCLIITRGKNILALGMSEKFNLTWHQQLKDELQRSTWEPQELRTATNKFFRSRKQTPPYLVIEGEN